jgi:FlaA1/EpsC-like NDP-sugar epimerase
MLNDKEILILGGTGSLGRKLVKALKQKYNLRGLRIFSRTEYLQWEFEQELKMLNLLDKVAFLLGDVRDKERLSRAMNNVDIVINAAAMKQVPACECNPFEAIKTNVYGAQNIIDCAIDNKVEKVLHISTDKSVEPINLYGMTKAIAEKLFIDGNIYAGGHNTIMSCVRYGNVLDSRGSILPLFREQSKNGFITITDKDMTRFLITLDEVVEFIINCLNIMQGNEIFIPKMKSKKIVDLAKEVCPGIEQKIIGIRKGEKLHEVLISQHETVHMEEKENKYILRFDKCYTPKIWNYNSLENLNAI